MIKDLKQSLQQQVPKYCRTLFGMSYPIPFLMDVDELVEGIRDGSITVPDDWDTTPRQHFVLDDFNIQTRAKLVYEGKVKQYQEYMNRVAVFCNTLDVIEMVMFAALLPREEQHAVLAPLRNSEHDVIRELYDEVDLVDSNILTDDMKKSLSLMRAMVFTLIKK